tara:strand:+ start:1106 stop:1273 length:168 start_codon:yes stop_codon:yes gene_type:complete
MILLEIKTKEDFENDTFNLKYRKYEYKRRQQMINYLYRLNNKKTFKKSLNKTIIV